MNPSYKTGLHFALRGLEFVLKLRNPFLFAYSLFQKCASLCFQVSFKYLSSWGTFIDHFQSVDKIHLWLRGYYFKKCNFSGFTRKWKFSIYISKHIKPQNNFALSAVHNKTCYSPWSKPKSPFLRRKWAISHRNHLRWLFLLNIQSNQNKHIH